MQIYLIYLLSNRHLTLLSSSETSFSQPALTANGTIGGSAFAVDSDSTYSGYYPWLCFAPDNVYAWVSYAGDTHWYKIYNPYPIKVSNITITNTSTQAYNLYSCVIKGSNDNSTWATLTTITNNPNTAVDIKWDIPIPAAKQNFYKYYLIDEAIPYTSTAYLGIFKLRLTATYMYTPVDNTLPVHGNGYGVMFTNGTNDRYLSSDFMVSSNYAAAMGDASGAPLPIGTNQYPHYQLSNGIYGVTQDAAKSGLIVDTSLLNSYQPRTHIIKY